MLKVKKLTKKTKKIAEDTPNAKYTEEIVTTSEHYFVKELIQTSKIKIKNANELEQVGEMPGYMLDMVLNKEE